MSIAPLTILIADDVESNRAILRRLVAKTKHISVEATNGVEALDFLRSGAIDLALLDIMMPELSGLDVCREIRKERPAEELPVLFITARSEDRDVVEALEAGGNDYITKPINSAVFLARFYAQVRQLQATRALAHSYDALSKKKKMETVALFSAGIAHNFNNILGTIIGSSELIQMLSPEHPKIQRAAELILKAAKRGATLTDSLRAFCRAGEERGTSTPHEAVQAAIELSPRAERGQVLFLDDVPKDLPPLQIALPDITQVLLELFRNAIDAIDDGGQIRVAGRFDSQLRMVVLAVSDTGRGIEPHLLESMFDPFVSGKNLDTLVGVTLDGSGLGLSVAYNILASAGGGMRVATTGPEGTTMELSIPAVACAAEQESAAAY